MSIPKFLFLTLLFNLCSCSIALIQQDILAYPRYKVVLTNEKVPESTKNVEVPTSISNTMVMMSSLGQPFSCTIPNVQVERERLEREKEEQAKEETEQDIQATIDRGVALLAPLSKNCIRFFANTHQYWAYEYCHNQYVRQFHVERTHDGKVEKEQETASFYLGIHPGAETKTVMRKVGDKRYLVQEWTNGSNCDLTGEPRQVEVQFHCDKHGQDFVSSFVEVSTCHYQIVVSTPRLCEEMNLSHKHHAESHVIECKPIVPDNLIEQEQTEKEANNAKKEEEEEEEVVRDLDILEKMDEKDILLTMISDLTEQINQLKDQMKAKPEVNYYTLTKENAPNQISGKEIQHILKQVKRAESKEQHDNKEAYHQNYHE
ncbi:uncharacterized protein EV154DRAFT_451555 [Mucor mucedo]|uniref:uncharacterized protein n=1 Tax=Mucor mucedo TaxID=29922 RepID=UPI002221275C|nr:uncharacterized protein EV154DRAFT_451555 [Mucor mucedo]KAI7876309.1 hypothetical protein EV154DRAFT_451555 [Mucor mucedo]